MEENLIVLNEEENIEENNDSTPEKEIKGNLSFVADVDQEFSYIDYHTDGLMRVGKDLTNTPYSLIKSIEVINDTERTIPGLIVSFSFDNDAFSIDDIVLPPCPSPAGYIRLPWLKVKKPFIDKIIEKVPCEMTISLVTSEGDIIHTSKHIFQILPISQPTLRIYEDKRLFAKYVTPLAPAVKQIANKAVLYNDGKPIVAYQNQFVEPMLHELKAIYNALHDENLLYQNPPARDSFAQRVRMPEESTRDKKATCLDSSILFCAVLEEVGYHPIINIIDGHAFCGVFLNEGDHFDNGITNNLSDVANRIAKGRQTVILIETTLITSGHSESFQDAMNAGKNHLSMYEGQNFDSIDINTCHVGSIFSAIPTEGNDFALENYIKQKEIEEKDLNPIINEKYEMVESEYERDRFNTWERKLLDLSEKNRLVNFRPSATTCVRLLSNSCLTDLLVEDDQIPLGLVSMTQKEVVSEFMKSEESVFEEPLSWIKDRMLLAFGIEKTLKSIMKKAKSALEETGASPLYLSLGMLTFTSPKTNHRIHSPFFLLPISIKKATGGKFYIMTYDAGDLKINDTFFEFYKIYHPDINFNSILNFDDLSKYKDVAYTFKEICGEDITLEEDFYFISNLSFAHQVMWLDMVKRKNELKKNVVVRSFVENQSFVKDKVISDDEPIENLEKYEDFAAPLYYDSSQLKAILDCGAGKSFILDGPPGTGKSQTIVNMIANAFYNKKKVLFVAEKKAALDVVADRLKKLGLGNYCLELHSNKATKSDFFSKLGAIMDYGKAPNPAAYYEKCALLTKKKNEIRAKINKMHDAKKYFYSLYDCIIIMKQCAYLENNVVKFDNSFIENFNNEKYNNIINLIDSYISFSKGVKNFDSNKIKLLGIQEVNYLTDKELIGEQLKNAINSIKKYEQEMCAFAKKLPFKIELTESILSKIFKIYEMAYNETMYLKSTDDLLKDTTEIKDTFKKIEDLKKLRDTLLSQYDLDSIINNVDLNNLTELYKNKQKKGRKLAKKELQPYTKFKIEDEVVGTILVEINSFINKKVELIENSKQFERITGYNAYGSLNSLEEIKNVYDKTKEFIDMVVNFGLLIDSKEAINYFLDTAVNKNENNKIDYIVARKAYNDYQETNKLIKTKYMVDESVLAQKGNYYEQLIDLLEYASKPEMFNDLTNLTNVNKLRNGFEQEGVYGLIKEVMLEHCRVNELYDLLKISLAKGCLYLYFNDSDINNFSSAYMEDQIADYKKAIKEYSETTVRCIASKITSEFYDINETSTKTNIGQLKKSIANNGRGVSIRGTLTKFGNIILRYCPCFLMSPLSAAQYLSVDGNDGEGISKFDIVIFDEASQIPTHEAIGPIARGNSLIVAGDPKQMPPSPYFSAGLQISEDEDDESDAAKFTDSPSLLDECLSICMPRHRLSYHYRSKHESLIQFSNENFYNNDLYTFPSSSTESSCIEFNYVNLKEPKRDSSLSDEELNTIIETFKGIYNNPKTSNKSVGIITFNIKQADLITDKINEILGDDKELAAIVEEAAVKTKEPWFVKSIENVQGDERDIIILSVGFALSKAGYPNVRGPLVAGDNNGGKRLNVAASRSKEKMIIISTIKASQFQDDSAIKSPGTKCLKHFLKFAEDSSFKARSGHDVDESSLLYYLKMDLQMKGFEVDANVGNSEFRVDLALRSKDSDHYELGLILDTKSIDNNISCRDKFYVQESVLNMMKWKILYIYAIEYFKNPEEVINKIVDAYNKEYKKNEDTIKYSIDKSEQVGFELDNYDIPWPNENAFLGTYDYTTAKFVTKVIEALSPISQNSLGKIIVEAFRRSKNLAPYGDPDRFLNMFFNKCRTFEQNQYFYWKDDNRVLDKFRLASGRDIDDIAREEIICAMKQIIKLFGDTNTVVVDGVINEEELFNKLMFAFGYYDEPVTSHFKDRFKYVYKYAKGKDLL